MHKHRVCHRDLKPDNLLVNDQFHYNPRLKVIDFNVAWDLSKEPIIKGKTGVEAWSAPETRKWAGYDEKCDVWAVGCIVLYMLAGELPILQDEASWSALCQH